MIHFVSAGNSLRDTLCWMDEWSDGGMNGFKIAGRVKGRKKQTEVEVEKGNGQKRRGKGRNCKEVRR